jgi:hypothetical protein
MIGCGEFLFYISKFASQKTQKTLKFLHQKKNPWYYQPHLKIHCKRTRVGGGGGTNGLKQKGKTNKKQKTKNQQTNQEMKSQKIYEEKM